MHESKINALLKSATGELETLQDLKEKPRKLLEKFDLTEEELAALETADAMVSQRGNIESQGSITFQTGSTITGTGGGGGW
jgi:hypothetical protein